MTKELVMKVEKGSTFVENYVTKNLLDCMSFWNREGEKAIENNKDGTWGNEKTQAMAQKMSADDFLLEMMLLDCKTFVNSPTAKESSLKYECGRTRSHIWVHINNERVLMFYF